MPVESAADLAVFWSDFGEAATYKGSSGSSPIPVTIMRLGPQEATNLGSFIDVDTTGWVLQVRLSEVSADLPVKGGSVVVGADTHVIRDARLDATRVYYNLFCSGPD